MHTLQNILTILDKEREVERLRKELDEKEVELAQLKEQTVEKEVTPSID